MAEWRVIPSFPDYEASDAGEVRRVRPGKNQRRVHILRPHVEKNGFPKVTFWVEGKSRSRWLNRVVCEAFHGPEPQPGMRAAHLNAVPDDCRESNLAWKTTHEVSAAKRDRGTENIGERNGKAKLTAVQVREIRRRYSALPRSSGGKRVRKGSLTGLAAEYGLTTFGVIQIMSGKNWRHLPWES